MIVWSFKPNSIWEHLENYNCEKISLTGKYFFWLAFPGLFSQLYETIWKPWLAHGLRLVKSWWIIAPDWYVNCVSWPTVLMQYLPPDLLSTETDFVLGVEYHLNVVNYLLWPIKIVLWSEIPRYVTSWISTVSPSVKPLSSVSKTPKFFTTTCLSLTIIEQLYVHMYVF